MHLPQGALRRQSIVASKAWLQTGTHRVIGFVTREMGLMVKRGNPLGITSLQRLLDPAIRFVNRDPDSGTGLLFDQLLKQQGIAGERIRGYAQIEFTHAAVAAYVASDMADAAFSVEAAARLFDLDFIRLLTEDYVFVCVKSVLETPPVKRVPSRLRNWERTEHFFASIISPVSLPRRSRCWQQSARRRAASRNCATLPITVLIDDVRTVVTG
jgi:molybdate-binding protein